MAVNPCPDSLAWRRCPVPCQGKVACLRSADRRRSRRRSAARIAWPPPIIGEDLTVTGNVLSRGEVQVDGQIQGDVHCSSLIVGEKAQITGGIVAEDVVVRGRVMGSVRGNRVTLQASSHVEGDVFHKSLAIEQGAFFEGKSRRSEDPIATAPRLEGMQTSGA